MRIAILQQTMVLLQNQKLGHFAWDVLETAVDTPNAEIQAAIIGN